MSSVKPRLPSLLLLQDDSRPTAAGLSVSRPLRASKTPVLKTTARRWAEEQLLQARAKTEAQRRCFWLETRTEMKKRAREVAECSVKLRRVILVGFTPPLLSKDATLMASDTNNAASSSKIANAISSPCRPPLATLSSPTSPTSLDDSATQAKLRSSSRRPMTWGTLRDQVRTPSLKQMEPSRPPTKKRRRGGSEGEVAEAGLEEHRGERGGQVVRRYAT